MMIINVCMPIAIYANDEITDNKKITQENIQTDSPTESVDNSENGEIENDSENESNDNLQSEDQEDDFVDESNDNGQDKEQNDADGENKEENPSDNEGIENNNGQEENSDSESMEDEILLEGENEENSENTIEENMPTLEEQTDETLGVQTYSNLIIEDGIYVIRSALNKNMVLDIADGAMNNSANLQLWKYNGNFNQQRFRITNVGNGYYTIQAVHSKKVLDVEGGGKTNGTNVSQYDSNGTDAQKWQILDLGNGQVSFVSKCNGLYLDVSAGSTANGANIQVYEGNGTNSQKFILERNDYVAERTVEDGIYTIKLKLNTNKVLDVAGGSTKNSANVQIWENDNVRQQRFKVTYYEQGYYKIEALHSGKVLEVAGGGMTSGTNVQQYEWNGTDSQKWIIQKNADGTYCIRSILNGYYLDIASGNTNNGTNVQVYEGNGTNAQKFKLELEGKQTIKDGIYKINTKLNANMYVNIKGSNVDILTNENIETQRFYVKYEGDGYYTIQSIANNKVVDLQSGNTASGANIQIYESNGTEAQKWIIKEAGNGYYYIESRLSLMVMDVQGGTAKDKQNIQAYELNYTDSQKFKFVAVEEAEGSQTIEDGIYNIATALNKNYVLDIAGASTSNSANVQIWSNANENQQKFLVEYQGNGYYIIEALHSGKVLDVASGVNQSGANVWQYENNHSNAQSWMIKDAGDGAYYIISKCNGLFLDVSGGSSANGTNVQVYEGNKTNSQKFFFLEPPLVSNGTYRISTALNNKSVIDISDGSKEDGANVQIWMSTNVSQQNFKVEYIGEEYYKITAEHSGLVLTVKDGNVIQSKYTGSDVQKWKIVDAGEGYCNIISKADGQYLDVAYASTSNGTNVQVYEGNGSNAQKFRFENLCLKGIDVSEFNGLINWEYVKRSGIDFAMIRIGYRGYGAAGNFMEDAAFRRNIEGAKRAGLKVGIYFFTQAVNKEEAVEEANWVLNILNQSGYADKIDYPIAIDTEWSTAPNNSGRADNLDVATRTLVCKTFCEVIQQNGYTPMIYASRNWFYDNLNMDELNQFDIWVAQYNSYTDYTGHYEMWQHTSEGTVSGISGHVDLNIGYKRY